MEHFGKIFKKNKKFNQNVKNELIKQDLELERTFFKSNFEVMAIGQQDLGVLKRVFEPIVKEAVKELEKTGVEPEKIYKAVIPSELMERFTLGELKLMKAVDGSLLPNIVDGKNQIVKKIRLEEIDLVARDVDLANELSNRILNQKLDSISKKLDAIIEIAEEINKSLQNINYGKIIGAIRTIEQSYLNEGRNTRQQLQNNAQGTLNEAIAVLEIEMESGLQYFRDWDKRIPLLNNYSTKQTKRKLNKLMEDFLFLNNAKSALIELKRKQGFSNENLRLMASTMNDTDSQLTNAEIGSWLSPKSTENKWQHDLINEINMNNRRIVIEYNIDQLIEEGSGSDND